MFCMFLTRLFFVCVLSLSRWNAFESDLTFIFIVLRAEKCNHHFLWHDIMRKMHHFCQIHAHIHQRKRKRTGRISMSNKKMMIGQCDERMTFQTLNGKSCESFNWFHSKITKHWLKHRADEDGERKKVSFCMLWKCRKIKNSILFYSCHRYGFNLVGKWCLFPSKWHRIFWDREKVIWLERENELCCAVCKTRFRTCTHSHLLVFV